MRHKLWEKDGTEPRGTPRDEGNMKEEEEPEVTGKDLLVR